MTTWGEELQRGQELLPPKDLFIRLDLISMSVC